jgi:hypothetical protein
MSTHDRYVELLARRRELNPTERHALETHLVTCTHCSRLADEYALQSAALRSMPQVTPPPALRARVLAAAREPRQTRSPFRRFVPAFTAAGATALLAAIVVFAWIHRPQSPTNSALSVTSTPRPHATFVTKRTGVKSAATAKSNRSGSKSHHSTTKARLSRTQRASHGGSTSSTSVPTSYAPATSGLAALGPPAPYPTQAPAPTVQENPTQAPPTPMPTAALRPTAVHHSVTRAIRSTATAIPAHVVALPAPTSAPTAAASNAPVAPIVSPSQPPPTAVPFGPTVAAGIAAPLSTPTSTPSPGVTPVTEQAVGATATPTSTSTVVSSPPPPATIPAP